MTTIVLPANLDWHLIPLEKALVIGGSAISLLSREFEMFIIGGYSSYSGPQLEQFIFGIDKTVLAIYREDFQRISSFCLYSPISEV